MNIAGLERSLPLCPISDTLYIGAFVMFGDTELTEACAHAPLEEDIGRVKLPRLLRRRVGAGLSVDVVGGSDFPSDLTPYDLVIQCGACMFNRKYVLHRIQQAKDQGVAMTNYGVAIAQLKGILDKIVC